MEAEPNGKGAQSHPPENQKQNRTKDTKKLPQFEPTISISEHVQAFKNISSRRTPVEIPSYENLYNEVLKNRSISDYAVMAIDAELNLYQELTEPPTLLSIDECTVLTLGNFLTVIGKAKSRKTFFILFILAALITGNRIYNFQGHLQPGQMVLYIDTEQSNYHVSLFVQRLIKLTDLSIDTVHDRFKAFCLRPYPTLDRLEIVRHLIENTPNLGCIAIDGLRDLTTDINDATRSTEIVDFLMGWTQVHNIGLITVLHQNKTDTNARGHLGTEVLNKGETTISITKDLKDKETSIVCAEYARNKDFEDFAFSIDEYGLPFVCNMPVSATKQPKFDPMAISTAQHYELLEKVFKGSKNMSYSNLWRNIKITYSEAGLNFGDNRAKEIVQILENQKIVTAELIGAKKAYSFEVPF